MGSIFGKAKKENPESGNRRQQTQQAPNKKNGGSAAAVEITSKDRAVLDLKNARDKLRRYRGQLEKDSQKLEGQVKTLIALKQKNRALLLLKLKKVKENELETLDAKLMNVYSMIQSVEWASINVSVIAAIESGTSELKRMHDERSLDDVEALMAETEDAIEMENKISQLLSGQLNEAEDEELSKELELLMSTSAPNYKSTITNVTPMGVPSKDAVVNNDAVKPQPLPPMFPDEKRVPLSLPDVPQTPILPMVPTGTPTTTASPASKTNRQPILS